MSTKEKPKLRKRLGEWFKGRRAASPAPSATQSTNARSSDQGNAKHGSKTSSIIATELSAPPSLSAADAQATRPSTEAIATDPRQPPAAMISRLAALGACIQGHESLYKASSPHRDIWVNNLIIAEDEDLYPAFLIDLDLAVGKGREESSGAKGKTGTRAFMAISILLGEQHSFIYDLESFFWVLFWVCIHYNGPGKDIGKRALRVGIMRLTMS